MNAFKMIPKGKKPASPRLQLAPLNESRPVKLRGGDKTVHSTRRPRGPILNTGRSINTKMSKMRTGKKKMRNVTNITPAVRTFRRGALLHLKQTIGGTVTISKKAFKNEPIGMRIPLAVKSKGGFKVHMLTTLPHRGRNSELSHKKATKGHANNMLQRLERLLTKPPNTLALVIKNTRRRDIEMPPQKLKVFKEKSNRAKAAQLRAVSKELADTRSTALNEISFPIRKGSTSGRKRVV